MPTDITEDGIREVVLPDTDLVDVKVCAVDAVWSGLKLMVRRERHRSRGQLRTFDTGLPKTYCERFALSIYPIAMIVCVCNAIREAEVRKAAREGASCPVSAYRAYRPQAALRPMLLIRTRDHRRRTCDCLANSRLIFRRFPPFFAAFLHRPRVMRRRANRRPHEGRHRSSSTSTKRSRTS